MKNVNFDIQDKLILNKTADQVSINASLDVFSNILKIFVTIGKKGQIMQSYFLDNFEIENTNTGAIIDFVKSSVSSKYEITYI